MRLTTAVLSRFRKPPKIPEYLPEIGQYSKDYSNLPDRYILRAMRQIGWVNPKGPQFKPNALIERKKFKFDVYRPWTHQFQQDNAPGKYHAKVFVEPVKQWSFFRGDRVEVLVGKDKGKQGIVRQIIQERNWVLVEGLNCELKKVGERKGFDGVYIQEEKPLLVTSEVSLVDPSDLRATSIEWRFTESGEKVRVSTRTGRIVPMPGTAEETIDYKTKAAYKEQPKDTKSGDVTEITFKPKLCTFEMDIMESMGIKEDRVPPKTYWY